MWIFIIPTHAEVLSIGMKSAMRFAHDCQMGNSLLPFKKKSFKFFKETRLDNRLYRSLFFLMRCNFSTRIVLVESRVHVQRGFRLSVYMSNKRFYCKCLHGIDNELGIMTLRKDWFQIVFKLPEPYYHFTLILSILFYISLKKNCFKPRVPNKSNRFHSSSEVCCETCLETLVLNILSVLGYWVLAIFPNSNTCNPVDKIGDRSHVTHSGYSVYTGIQCKQTKLAMHSEHGKAWRLLPTLRQKCSEAAMRFHSRCVLLAWFAYILYPLWVMWLQSPIVSFS